MITKQDCVYAYAGHGSNIFMCRLHRESCENCEKYKSVLCE